MTFYRADMTDLDGDQIRLTGWDAPDSAFVTLEARDRTRAGVSDRSVVYLRLDREKAVELIGYLTNAIEARDKSEDQIAQLAAKAEAAKADRALTILHSKYRVGDLVIVGNPAYATLDGTDYHSYVDDEFYGKAGTVAHADPFADKEEGCSAYTDPRVVTVSRGDGNTQFIHVAHLRNISLEVREGTFPEADLTKLTAKSGPLAVGDEVTVDGLPAKVTTLDLADTMWPYAVAFTGTKRHDWVRPVNADDHTVLTGEFPDYWS